MDLSWQFVKDGFNQTRGEFITTQNHMAPVINTNQEKMKANQEKMEATKEANLVDLQAKMKMVLD
jgi:hypothetical protein